MLKKNLTCSLVVSSLIALVSGCGGKVIPNPGEGGTGGSDSDAGSGASGGAGGASGGSGGTGGAVCNPLRGCTSNTRCSDGCNTCSCANGNWVCTERACVDAGPACTYSDPAKTYVSKSPAQCKAIDYICPPNGRPFFDECGCGCIKEPICDIPECLRAVQCVEKCGGPVLQSGCCPCAPGTFDETSCARDGGPSTCACATTAVTWGMDGGLVAYSDSSSLIPCGTYVHERQGGFDTTHPNAACKLELTCGANEISAAMINKLLAASDVVAALKKAPIVYGVDSRPVDGQVFRITVNGRSIDVGGPCSSVNSGSACLEIPAGVSALVRGLQGLDKQGLSRPACANTFR